MKHVLISLVDHLMNRVTFLALLHILGANLRAKDFLQSPESIVVGILSYCFGIC